MSLRPPRDIVAGFIVWAAMWLSIAGFCACLVVAIKETPRLPDVHQQLDSLVRQCIANGGDPEYAVDFRGETIQFFGCITD